MIGHGAKFGRKQEEAIAALLTQRNVDEAAKAIGVAPKTLLRWMKVPEFKTAYREARRATFPQTVARLQQGSPAAATTLLKIMVDQNAPYASRVRAAECVINHSIKARLERVQQPSVEDKMEKIHQAALAAMTLADLRLLKNYELLKRAGRAEETSEEQRFAQNRFDAAYENALIPAGPGSR